MSDGDKESRDVSNIDKLESAIWTTRKCRINAEERLLFTNSFVQHINIYYSCLSAAFAIIALWYENKALTMLSAILAPVVAICIVFLNAQRYEQRAEAIKRNYIELQRLLYRVQRLKLSAGNEDKAVQNYLSELQKIQEEYGSLMKDTENHLPVDYWKTIRQEKVEKQPSDNERKEHRKICFLSYGYECIIWIAHGIAYIAPVLGYFIIAFILE